jgi:hypothetical protein
MTPIRQLVASFLLLGLVACESIQLTKGTVAKLVCLLSRSGSNRRRMLRCQTRPLTAIIL